jgi:hypothetical protein
VNGLDKKGINRLVKAHLKDLGIMLLDKDREFGSKPVREITAPPDTIRVEVGPVVDISVAVDETVESATRAKAKKMIHLIEAGETPGQAAKSVGTTLREIGTSAEMQEAIRALLSVSKLDAETRANMVRAGLNRLFMEAIAAPDMKNKRLALDVAKQIAADPEVNAGTQDVISIDMTGIDARIKDVSLPGIEPPKEKDDTRGN